MRVARRQEGAWCFWERKGGHCALRGSVRGRWAEEAGGLGFSSLEAVGSQSAFWLAASTVGFRFPEAAPLAVWEMGCPASGEQEGQRPQQPSRRGRVGCGQGRCWRPWGGTPGQDEPTSLTPTFQDVGDTGGPHGAGKPGKVRCSFPAHSVAHGLQVKVWDSMGHYLQCRCISEARKWVWLPGEGPPGSADNPGELGLGWGRGRIPPGGRLGNGDKSGRWSAVSRATSQVRCRKGHASKASQVEGLTSRWMNRHGTSVCWHRVHVILLWKKTAGNYCRTPSLGRCAPCVPVREPPLAVRGSQPWPQP